MRDENTRNTIIIYVFAALILELSKVFEIDPPATRRETELSLKAPPAAAAAGARSAPQLPQAMTRQAALPATPRAPIDTASL
ncbi:hypothetical protein L9G16_23185, partial [Shewanella sp. A25]|nr:hypothetical protein [Shewanella shenzhenensis]